jgi:hypothetical protein
MDDTQLYTGVNSEPLGQFENELKNEEVEEIIKEQKRVIQEISPKLEGIIELIESEISRVMSIDRFISATTQSESDIRAELQATALYKNYLEGLKNKFILDLQEAKKGSKDE